MCMRLFVNVFCLVFLFSKKWVVAWGCKQLFFFCSTTKSKPTVLLQKSFLRRNILPLWNKCRLCLSLKQYFLLSPISVCFETCRMASSVNGSKTVELHLPRLWSFRGGARVVLCVMLSRSILSVYYLAYQKTWSFSLIQYTIDVSCLKIRENHQNDRDMIDSLFATRSKRRRELPFFIFC